MYNKLIDWSRSNFHTLPWRRNRSLYGTLVSEIMLQQTTVGTVLNYFDRFIVEYPDFKAIAEATEEQLTISWKGLGYYRRARNLKKACIEIARQGEVPKTVDELKAIPGIGDYTAGAILGIGMDLPYLAIDGNLERVIARLYGICEIKGEKLKKLILKKFNDGEICQEIYKIGGRNFNESLMDLGRNFCRAQKAACDLCPMTKNCIAFKKGEVDKIPIPDAKKSKSYNLELLRIILRDKDKVFIYQKKEQEWLAGQWELPTFILKTEDEKLAQYARTKQLSKYNKLPSYKTLITKYKITNKVLQIEKNELQKLGLDLPNGKWVDLSDRKLNISTATQKALKLLKY